MAVLVAYTDSLGVVSPAHLGSAPDLAHSHLTLVFGKYLKGQSHEIEEEDLPRLADIL